MSMTGVARRASDVGIGLGHQEVHAWRAEGVDHLAHARLVAAAGRDQLVEPRRPAHRSASSMPAVSARNTHLDDRRARLAERLEDLVRVRIERAAQAADRLVVGKRELDRARRRPLHARAATCG